MRKLLLSILILYFSICSVLAQNIYSEYKLRNNEVLINQASKKINLLDPSRNTSGANANYPGFRGANQLVVYTPAYGCRTNTNEFGAEAIVVDNIVTEISGADSLIPQNGFVISGHGQAKSWINNNIIVGSKISINKDTQTLSVYTTTDSYIFSAERQINEVKYIVEKYSSNHNDYNSKKADEYINQAENYINKAKKSNLRVQQYSELAIQAANNALSAAIPYKANELRGVWIRPTFKSKEEICKALNTLDRAGINTIFLETYYHGMTIFPSETMENKGFMKQNPDYEGFDYLDFWIHEAHKRNIKVHIWFESFYIGNKNPSNNPKNIVFVKPNWANVTKKDCELDKPTPSISEHCGYFIDPANPEVQSFLIELLCEIIQKYRPDGINIDYIRYPQAIAPQFRGSELSSWGYTRYAREEFKSIYGVDPVELDLFEPLWESWNEYRRNKVTKFVRRVSKVCRANNIELTAVIFPNRQSALDLKHQDWKCWSDNNYIDGFTPLFLTCDPATASELMKEVMKNKQPKTKLYAGLFITFMNGAESDLIKQINELRNLSLDGFSIFDYAHLAEKYIKHLTISICSVPTTESTNTQNQPQNLKNKRNRGN